MLRSFRDKDTRAIAEGHGSKRVSESLRARALETLMILNGATALSDLQSYPALRLKKLRGSRQGQYSIRVNRQYRICFVWKAGDAFDIELVDYH